jgi:hypothetical protein
MNSDPEADIADASHGSVRTCVTVRPSIWLSASGESKSSRLPYNWCGGAIVTSCIIVISA